MMSLMEHSAVDILREWFNHGQSGCKFAGHLAARDPRLAFIVHLGAPTEIVLDELEEQVDAAGKTQDVSMLVCPRIESEAGIIELLRHLAQGRRWQVRVHEPRGRPESQMLGLGVTFETTTGDRSAAMGFAPSGFMPVTRRAPFVALALWAGGRENPKFPYSPAGTVNMAVSKRHRGRLAYLPGGKASISPP